MEHRTKYDREWNAKWDKDAKRYATWTDDKNDSSHHTAHGEFAAPMPRMLRMQWDNEEESEHEGAQKQRVARQVARVREELLWAARRANLWLTFLLHGRHGLDRQAHAEAERRGAVQYARGALQRGR